jgi:quercetin dioxygenase-like cupin family protein
MSEQRKLEVVTRGYVSERGPLEINENPKVARPNPDAPISEDGICAYFQHDALAEKYGEEATREKIVEMAKALRGGAATTPLFAQEGPNGMSLVHVWFGPNFELFRHSHPKYGDCLYYVVAGELTLGKRRLRPGSTFFLPNGMPYKYTAGPAGVELLEFRAGGGVDEAPGMCLDELSLDAIDKLIDCYHTNSHLWEAPINIGDVAFVQRELDFGDAGS